MVSDRGLGSNPQKTPRDWTKRERDGGREKGRKSRKEEESREFLGVGSNGCGGWQVQNLQGGQAGWGLGEELQLKGQGSVLAVLSVPRRLVFFPLRRSTNWMRLTHIMEGKI